MTFKLFTPKVLFAVTSRGTVYDAEQDCSYLKSTDEIQVCDHLNESN